MIPIQGQDFIAAHPGEWQHLGSWFKSRGEIFRHAVEAVDLLRLQGAEPSWGLFDGV